MASADASGKKPFDADQENSIKISGRCVMPRVQSRNMALHGLASAVLRIGVELADQPSRFSFADADRWEMKDSTNSRLASLRVSVPQKSAA